jgi:hypothetical protein
MDTTIQEIQYVQLVDHVSALIRGKITSFRGTYGTVLSGETGWNNRYVYVVEFDGTVRSFPISLWNNVADNYPQTKTRGEVISHSGHSVRN